MRCNSLKSSTFLERLSQLVGDFFHYVSWIGPLFTPEAIRTLTGLLDDLPSSPCQWCPIIKAHSWPVLQFPCCLLLTPIQRVCYVYERWDVLSVPISHDTDFCKRFIPLGTHILWHLLGSSILCFSYNCFWVLGFDMNSVSNNI